MNQQIENVTMKIGAFRVMQHGKHCCKQRQFRQTIMADSRVFPETGDTRAPPLSGLLISIVCDGL